MNVRKNPRITEKEIRLIKKAQEGDIKAFNKIFRHYKRFVERVLRNYVKDKDEARDIANIVFLKVYDKLSTFKSYDSFGGWLRVIANRTAIDYLRRMNPEQVFDPATERLPVAEQIGNTEDDVVNRMTYEQLLKKFEELPEDHKKICIMFYKDNLTIDQISEALQKSKGTIKSILSRTRNKFKNNLKTL